MRPQTDQLITAYLRKCPALKPCEDDLHAAIGVLAEAFRRGNKLMICGNGRSAADSDHIAGELVKAFAMDRPLSPQMGDRIRALHVGPDPAVLFGLQRGLPAISLVGNGALVSAIANDQGQELVFAQQVMGLGTRGDVLMGITTSGSSRNVLRGFQVARIMEVTSILLTGDRAPTSCKDLADIAICVPASATADVQELHLPAYHLICSAVESEMFAQ